MNPDIIFQIANTSVIPFWLLIIIAPKWRYTNSIVYIFCTLMALIYSFYVFTGLSSFDFESFNSLEGVKTMFTSDVAVLAGWIHYLVFDLLVGIWIVNQAIKYGIKHYLVIPCLLLCFMFGPVGFLLFIILKLIKTKSIT